MAIATIGLGIGINLGIFSISRAIFLNSLGVPEANRLVYYTLGTGPDLELKFSNQQYEALRSTLGTNDVMAWQSHKCGVRTASEQASPATCALASGNAFSVLEIQPFAGQFFSEADDVSGGGYGGWTAVASYSYWKAHPNIVGQTVTVNDTSVRVVGVLPRKFAGVDGRGFDLLLPKHFSEAAGFDPKVLGSSTIIAPEWFVLGRLPNAVSIEQTQARLKAIEPSFEQTAVLIPIVLSGFFPNTPPGSLLGVHSAQMGVTLEYRALRTPLLLLEILAGAVLLFCCCNLVLLLVSRARREAHATAIRLVLGARRRDQMRFAVIEAAVLVGVGCVVAAPVAWSTAHGLSLAIQSAPGFNFFPAVSPSISLFVLASLVALAVASLTGAGASLWAAIRRASISLKEVVAGRVSARSKGLIVGIEVFASVVLMAGAVVSGFGFRTLSHNSGFDNSAVIVEPRILLTYGFEGMQRMVQVIRNSPGVEAVATTNVLPLSGSGSFDNAEAPSSGGPRQLRVWSIAATPHYFAAIGTRIVQGRAFLTTDPNGSVCVLSRRAATGLFPNGDALGKYLAEPECRVIGIAEDAHFASLSDPADAVVYQLSKHVQLCIVVKAKNSNLALQAVQEAINKVILQGVGPNRGVTLGTIQEHVDKNLRLWHVTTLAGTLCALLAGIVLAIGLFGVLSLQVTEREREIGIRRALGANMVHVSLALVRQLGPAIACGLLVGTAGALLVASRLVEVYQLSVGQVLACLLGTLLLVAVLMLAAAAVPLARAFAISPVECLSAE